MKKEIWQGVNGDYLGASGISTVEEFAQLIIEAGYEDMVTDDIEDEDPSDAVVLAETIKFLNYHGARCERVPVPVFRKEWWGDQTRPCGFDEKPGRGFIKVIGVSF